MFCQLLPELLHREPAPCGWEFSDAAQHPGQDPAHGGNQRSLPGYTMDFSALSHCPAAAAGRVVIAGQEVN